MVFRPKCVSPGERAAAFHSLVNCRYPLTFAAHERFNFFRRYATVMPGC